MLIPLTSINNVTDNKQGKNDKDKRVMPSFYSANHTQELLVGILVNQSAVLVAMHVWSASGVDAVTYL